MDILTGENVSSIQVANMASFIGQLLHTVVEVEVRKRGLY